MKNYNLFAALRAAFPKNLDTVALETDAGVNYCWRDLERATAMMANLLGSLGLPAGAPANFWGRNRLSVSPHIA